MKDSPQDDHHPRTKPLSADRERRLETIRSALHYCSRFRAVDDHLVVHVVKLPKSKAALGTIKQIIHDIRLLALNGMNFIVVYDIDHDQLEDAAYAAKQTMNSIERYFKEDAEEHHINLFTKGGDSYITAEAAARGPVDVVRGSVLEIKGDRLKLCINANRKRVEVVGPLVASQETSERILVCADELARKIAVAIQAQKLIFLTDSRGFFKESKLISDLKVHQAQKLIDENAVTGRMQQILSHCVVACEEGVDRCHVISWRDSGSLLEEFCTDTGVGTMVRKDHDGYRDVCEAESVDIEGVAKLVEQGDFEIFAGDIQQLSAKDVLSNPSDVFVYKCDGIIRGLVKLNHQELGTVDLLVVHADHAKTDVMVTALLEKAIDHARASEWETLSASNVRAWAAFEDVGFQRHHEKGESQEEFQIVLRSK